MLSRSPLPRWRRNSSSLRSTTMSGLRRSEEYSGNGCGFLDNRVQLVVEIDVAGLEGVRDQPKAIPTAESQPLAEASANIRGHIPATI